MSRGGLTASSSDVGLMMEVQACAKMSCRRLKRSIPESEKAWSILPDVTMSERLASSHESGDAGSTA